MQPKSSIVSVHCTERILHNLDSVVDVNEQYIRGDGPYLAVQRGESSFRQYAVSLRTDLAEELPTSHSRPCATAAGIHEPHAQWYRGDEGERAANLIIKVRS